MINNIDEINRDWRVFVDDSEDVAGLFTAGLRHFSFVAAKLITKEKEKKYIYYIYRERWYVYKEGRKKEGGKRDDK